MPCCPKQNKIKQNNTQYSLSIEINVCCLNEKCGTNRALITRKHTHIHPLTGCQNRHRGFGTSFNSSVVCISLRLWWFYVDKYADAKSYSESRKLQTFLFLPFFFGAEQKEKCISFYSKCSLFDVSLNDSHESIN